MALFAECTNPEITARAIRAGVSAYVVDGLEPGRIGPIVDIGQLLQAETNCGSCLPRIEQILRDCGEEQGLRVDTNVSGA